MHFPQLTTAEIEENPAVKEKYSFEIITPARVFPISCSSEQEKQEWITHLRTVLKDFKA
tara:strand:+ start:556 stop:732 length:177 start_codon:yes stop_codon:yes gene_type:complete